MEKERRRSIQDEVHVEEGPNGPVKGINSRAEVEGGRERGWALEVGNECAGTELRDADQRERDELKADVRNAGGSG